MLQALELVGFKSFADKTVFDFDPGITGVVGPNGSGKSNVVDAIKWILGDQSAKSLRGKEMTDVIFNGSSSRKSSPYAEATLIINNASGFLPVEQEQVEIGRRLWRSGDSEYLVNRNSARLKDIRNLFMGTGAGSATYAIIEQGRVDQILQANPTNRRLVFEEAAGISRFKQRKNEALRKLERVDQNLLRLQDIVDEVESQLNSIRSQAKKATKFREVSSELKTLWVGLAADDFRAGTERLQIEEQQSDELGKKIDALNEQAQYFEAQIADLDSRIQDVDDQLRAVESDKSAVRSDIASHSSTIRHETARQAEIAADLRRLRRQQLSMEFRSREATAELERTSNVLELEEADWKELNDDLQSCETAVRELTESLDKKREELSDARETVEELTGDSVAITETLKELRGQSEAAALSRAAAQQQKNDFELKLVDAKDRYNEHVANVAAAENALQAAQTLMSETEVQLETAINSRDDFQVQLTELRKEITQTEARISVLEDLEKRHEGLGVGVREILDRAKTSDHSPWNVILGTVVDLLEVDLDNAALLEVALGARAQLVIVDDIRPIIDYLEDGRCSISGRVGFLEIREEESPLLHISSGCTAFQRRTLR